jgi:5-methyltetrahydropteroyltriglutamate--homocysteine methyltransferase
MCPQAQLAGLHSRSEELIELTRAYDRGQAEWSQVSNRLDQETRHIISLQEKLGFEYISDGALAWQDPLRPLTRALDGVTYGTRYSRWFDTNTFYQKPVVTGKISAKDSQLDNFVRADLLPGGKKWKVTLPGPYTFSELSENRHYPDKIELILSIARAEHDLIKKLAKIKVSLVQLSEPCLVYRPYREDQPSTLELETALHALTLVSQGSPAKVSIQTYFGDVSPVLANLLDLPVDGVGFDLYETDYSTLNIKTSKRVILGISDSRESQVEDAKWIAETAARVSKHVSASDYVFSPNSDLKYLPRTVADAKTTALAEAARIFQEAN